MRAAVVRTVQVDAQTTLVIRQCEWQRTEHCRTLRLTSGSLPVAPEAAGAGSATAIDVVPPHIINF